MLIKNIAEAKQHMPIGAESISKLPDIAGAEERYLVPVIGQGLYDLLNEAESYTDEQKRLLNKCRAVIVPFAFAMDLPLMQNRISAGGIKIAEEDNSRSAFKWEYQNTIEALNARGYDAQEKLIVFLKKNIETYPLFADSDYNAPGRFAIIRDGDELKTILPIIQPHRSYMMLQSLMSTTVAELYLKPMLGDDFYEALSARIIGNSTTPNDAKVLPLLRMGTARMTMLHAAAEMNIQFSAQGFTIVDGAIKDQVTEGRKNAADSNIETYQAEQKRVGMSLLQKAVYKINGLATSTVFPEFFNSALYRNPNPEVVQNDNNYHRTGIFAM